MATHLGAGKNCTDNWVARHGPRALKVGHLLRFKLSQFDAGVEAVGGEENGGESSLVRLTNPHAGRKDKGEPRTRPAAPRG